MSKNSLIKLSIEFLIVLIAAGIYTYVKIIPEYKEKIGSSDYLIDTKTYSNMIEIKTNNIDFGIIINDKSKLTHLLFFTESSLILYNKYIENNTLDYSLDRIIYLLKSNNLLSNKSDILLIRYSDDKYQLFKDKFSASLNNNNLDCNIVENSSTLKDKCSELNIKVDNDSKRLLWYLEIYSKDITGLLNNKDNNKDYLTDMKALNLCKNVYKKIEEYITINKIDNISIDSTEFVINLIQADKEGKYSPTSNSWYYVKNKKIYAYVEFYDNINRYGYCFNGDIELNKKGMCSNEKDD